MPTRGIGVPGAVSVTVIVHVVVPPIGMGFGEQLIVVLVLREFALMDPQVLPEVTTRGGPENTVPMQIENPDCAKWGDGVKLVEQDEAVPEMGDKVHDDGSDVPVLELGQLTVPSGGVADPGLRSVNVAVQVVGLFTGTEFGAHTTLAFVARRTNWVVLVVAEK